MPMPAATNRKRCVGDPWPGTVNGNALRGPFVVTQVPTANASWTSVEPPPPSGMRRTAIR